MPFALVEHPGPSENSVSLLANKGQGEELARVSSLAAIAEGQEYELSRLVGESIRQGLHYEVMIQKALEWNASNKPPLKSGELLKIFNTNYLAEGGDASDIWQEPQIFHAEKPPEISAELLPSWLGVYAKEISSYHQTSEALAVMIGLSVIATSVQKKYMVSHANGYLEPLSIWTVSALPSSERKTAVMDDMTKPLVQWQLEQADLLRERVLVARNARAIIQKRIEKLRNKAANAADAADREELGQEIYELEQEMPDELRFPQLIAGDVTPERLQDMLVEQGERMALISDEGGIFEVMGGLYSNGKVNIDVFLQGYSGSSVNVERQGRRVLLNSPALTFGLAVQPAVIENLSSGSKKMFRGKGALARFLYCFPDTMSGKRDVRSNRQRPEQAAEAYMAGVKVLLDVEIETDDMGSSVPRVLTLDADAVESYYEYAEYVEQMLGPDGELSGILDWGGKLLGSVLRIAGLLNLVENGPECLTISKDIFLRASALGDMLIGHAKIAFGLIGAKNDCSDARRVFKWLAGRRFRSFTRSECLTGTNMVSLNLEMALSELEERHIIKAIRIKTEGRTMTFCNVNPLLTNIQKQK